MRVVARSLTLLTLSAALGFGQAAENDWSNLSRLRAGQSVEVTDARMKSLRGRFAAVSDEGISLQAENSVTTIARADVMSVKDRSVSHRGRNALIGAGVGAATGAALPSGTVTVYRKARPSQK